MHHWGGNFKYFGDVGEAADWIGQYCRKWGRINVAQTKEKYGTARVYCSFGWYQLHSITHPGYHYSQYPKWLWKFDLKFLSKLVRPFNFLIVPYQMFIYRRAYEKAFQKWPLIKREIIGGADYPEFVSSFWESVALCDNHCKELKYEGWVKSGSCIACEKEKDAKTQT